MGVRVLPLLSGRCKALRLSGRCRPLLLSGRPPGWDETDARLLGRLPVGSREELGIPNDSRLTPESAAPWLTEDAADACDVRFLLLRIVTLFGMWCPNALPFRGLARGGVFVGAGSLDRAEYTRSSSFCILPISPRIW
jgi:hypothetical protein